MSGFLIAHIGHTLKYHEHITWWKPDSCGYTMCIDKAGIYDEAEARGICSSSVCIAVPKAVAEQLARPTPYYRRADGTLNKLYDGGPHRVVPNSPESWKALMAIRLCDFPKPEKPTPISPSKARAIYLPSDMVAA